MNTHLRGSDPETESVDFSLVDEVLELVRKGVAELKRVQGVALVSFRPIPQRV